LIAKEALRLNYRLPWPSRSCATSWSQSRPVSATVSVPPSKCQLGARRSGRGTGASRRRAPSCLRSPATVHQCLRGLAFCPSTARVTVLCVRARACLHLDVCECGGACCDGIAQRSPTQPNAAQRNSSVLAPGGGRASHTRDPGGGGWSRRRSGSTFCGRRGGCRNAPLQLLACLVGWHMSFRHRESFSFSHGSVTFNRCTSTRPGTGVHFF